MEGKQDNSSMWVLNMNVFIEEKKKLQKQNLSTNMWFLFIYYFCFLQRVNVILTQWSRACKKSNNSSVQSSSVEDRELTLALHCSKRSRVWAQCSAASHFSRTVSRGSCSERYSTEKSDFTSNLTGTAIQIKNLHNPETILEKRSAYE